MIKPERLCIGDTVGLISPAGPVKEELLYKGIHTLEDMGLGVRLGKHVGDKKCYLAGSDEDRVEDLNKMFSDPEVKGIFCVRGGYGSTRILHMIDYDLIMENPKIFVGYSDITALHLAIERSTGLVTFHGPMAAEMTEDFPLYNKRYLQEILFDACSSKEIKNPPGESAIESLFLGNVQGSIKGGNLSLLCSTIGTEYEIDTKGCIFFVEEIGEPPHKIDRMLNHLKMAGKFKDAAAIVFGQWTNCRDDRHPKYSVYSIMKEIAGEEKKPCLANLMIGHGKYNITIPLGCKAVIEGSRIYIEESGVL